MPLPKMSFDLSSSSSASAAQKNEFNQNFSNLFGDKNLAKNDFTKPALVIGGLTVLFLVLKKKKLV